MVSEIAKGAYYFRKEIEDNYALGLTEMDKMRFIIGPLWGRRPPTSHQRSRREPGARSSHPRGVRAPRGGRGRRASPAVWPRRSAGAAPPGWPLGLAGRADFEVRPGLMRGWLGPGIKCQLPRDAAGQTKGAGPPRGARRVRTKVETGARRGPPRRLRPLRALAPDPIHGPPGPSRVFPRRELQRRAPQPPQAQAFAQPWPE